MGFDEYIAVSAADWDSISTFTARMHGLLLQALRGKDRTARNVSFLPLHLTERNNIHVLSMYCVPGSVPGDAARGTQSVGTSVTE